MARALLVLLVTQLPSVLLIYWVGALFIRRFRISNLMLVTGFLFAWVLGCFIALLLARRWTVAAAADETALSGLIASAIVLLGLGAFSKLRTTNYLANLHDSPRPKNRRFKPSWSVLAALFLTLLFVGVAANCEKFVSTNTQSKNLNTTAEAAFQFDLAERYRLGREVPQNYVLAEQHYISAGLLGHSQAQQMLVTRYSGWKDWNESNQAAVKDQPANSGTFKSSFGIDYDSDWLQTDGFVSDPRRWSEAYVWASILAASGNPSAQSLMNEFKLKLSRTELIAAQSRSANIFDKITENLAN